MLVVVDYLSEIWAKLIITTEIHKAIVNHKSIKEVSSERVVLIAQTIIL